MKKYTNIEKLNEDIKSKKISRGETVRLDETNRDEFSISGGNLKVLETIPNMMRDNEYRKELRRLTFRFITGQSPSIIHKS